MMSHLWRSVGRRAILLAIFVLFAGQSRADALSDLNNAFREAYASAVAQTLAHLRASVPVLVNRFGQIALYRPGVEEPEIFSMDMKIYLQARSVAHTPVALYTRLVPFGLGKLDDQRLEWLAKYQALLDTARKEIEGREDVPAGLKVVQVELLENIKRYSQRIHQQGTLDPALVEEMGSAVKAAVQMNLEAAARTQLEQFRAQIGLWRQNYSNLKWDGAVVVIIGGHQARNRYLQRQFFDWLLRDEPSKEASVVFAEVLVPPAPLDKQQPSDALILLSKVMLDKGVANSVFGDPLQLQSDVMGEAAARVIKEWR